MTDLKELLKRVRDSADNNNYNETYCEGHKAACDILIPALEEAFSLVEMRENIGDETAISLAKKVRSILEGAK